MSCLKFSSLPFKSLFSLLLMLSCSEIMKVNAQDAQSVEMISNADVTIVRPLEQDNLFSMAGGERLQNEANNAIQQQNYALAIQKLQESRQVFNQLSNFHLQLANQFQGVNNRIYDARRSNALEAGQKRDEVTYLLAMTHAQAGESPLAIPLLIQVIESQAPTSELGKKAYQGLYDLGFANTPFVTNSNPETSQNSENPAPAETTETKVTENNIFSLSAGENLVTEAESLIEQQNFEGAIAKLQDARQMFQQLSGLHLKLANAFQGINPDIYDAQRKQAFETGQKRDEITYQMALLHRQKNQAPLAIPLLIQVISSQTPSSNLGRQAYQQLYDLGFVDAPYSSR
jgi:hypothetical protein